MTDTRGHFIGSRLYPVVEECLEWHFLLAD